MRTVAIRPRKSTARIMLIAGAIVVAVGGCSPVTPAVDDSVVADADQSATTEVADQHESEQEGPEPTAEVRDDHTPAPSPQQSATRPSPDPGASKAPGAGKAAGASGTPMTQAFAAGDSVVCSYTYEGYDAETTLQSQELFRIDQMTQGGLAHVIRGPETTYVWADGMVEAMEFDTQEFERTADGVYPTFTPADFDVESLFADGTCHVVQRVDDALVRLPSGMGSAPAN